MRTFTRRQLSIAAICLLSLSACDPSFTDIGPDRSNGVSDGGASTAGLILNIAGDKNGLYAIALNAGVWKTQIDANGKFNKWKQLPASPRYAHCMAVDPNDKNHIVVGSRKSDAIVDKNCGLWESPDGGNSFKRKTVNQFTACSNNIVNAVIITNESTILTSTPNGIGRKEKNATDFTFDQTLVTQPFTSIAFFGDRIVARTIDAIYLSNTDGKTWERHAIQLNFPGQNFRQDTREGLYSLSIIKKPLSNDVFVYVPVTRSPNGPCFPPDDGRDPCLPDVPPSNPPSCNYGSLLVFNEQTDQWNFQLIRDRGLGTGLGGRVFLKSFFSTDPDLQHAVGGNTNLFYCTGQNIFKATSINADGTATWENVTNGDRPCGEPKPSGIHSDLWDFHLDPSGGVAWVGCDGGVYQTAISNTQSTLALTLQNRYTNLNEGLHTQHIHEAFVAAGPPLGEAGVERYAYASQDNGGWESLTTDGVTNWNNPIGGDANIVQGDQGNTELVVVGLNLQTIGLFQFDNNPPPAAKPGRITILYRGNNFQFIQTLTSENPNPAPLLDAVALTTLPLQYMENKVLTNVPGELGTKTGAVILRNRSFAANPDINISKGAGWEIVFNYLPAGALAFWVAGGHTDPTYFLLCNQGSVTVLLKRKTTETSWTKLNLPAGVTIVPYATGFVQHGPVFVNPYNPVVVFLSCKDGIYRSYLSQKTLLFKKDEKLTNLVDNNEMYPLDNFFAGGNDLNVVRSNQSNRNCMYPISGVAFNRFDPAQVVAASPFTGIFLKNGSGDWKDLSGALPKPYTPVSSVNINNQGIYVTTEGRGILKIVNY